MNTRKFFRKIMVALLIVGMAFCTGCHKDNNNKMVTEERILSYSSYVQEAFKQKEFFGENVKRLNSATFGEWDYVQSAGDLQYYSYVLGETSVRAYFPRVYSSNLILFTGEDGYIYQMINANTCSEKAKMVGNIHYRETSKPSGSTIETACLAGKSIVVFYKFGYLEKEIQLDGKQFVGVSNSLGFIFQTDDAIYTIDTSKWKFEFLCGGQVLQLDYQYDESNNETILIQKGDEVKVINQYGDLVDAKYPGGYSVGIPGNEEY